jgi:Transposase, Mutator family
LTRSASCKDGKRKGEYPNIKFDFLGYCFRPRRARNSRDNSLFCRFTPAVSPSALTRIGKIELRIPQDRQGRFSTELFERYQRSEKALMAALTEMYIQGVSTRKVKAITEELIGHSFSASSVSAVVKKLDGELARFARRRLSEPFPYLVLDGRYEKVRIDSVIQSQAVLIAIGSKQDQRQQAGNRDENPTNIEHPFSRVGCKLSER